MEAATHVALRRVVDVAAVLAAIALILDAPFQFCHQGRCIACASGWLFSPPLFEGGRLLCSVHIEQLALRFAALALAWAILRAIFSSR